MVSDTIAAIATALSPSGIGIIRISGERAIEIIEQLFQSINANKNIAQEKSHTLHYGHIVHQGESVDEVLVSIMREPNTFTKEDVVEINCHGGVLVMQKILSLVLDQGARLAEPGEFTKRAFLNGRIDLSQAEAVIDIINAKTELALKSSVSHLEGSIKSRIHPLRNQLLEIIAHIEASIDYPEYDIEALSSDHLLHQLGGIKQSLWELMATANNGRILREGLKTVIIGKPNVGKSSLMNTLLKEQRAIVTEVPGTTRDTLEEHINVNGIPLKIIDTAGIRETEDVVEKIGVEKSKTIIEVADLIIMLVDGSKALDEEDRAILNMIREKKALVIINKIDLEQVLDPSEVKRLVKGPLLEISAKEDIGISQIEEVIKDMYFQGEINFNDQVYITNVRHEQALKKAVKSIDQVVEAIELSLPEDCYAIDLKNTYEALGEIIGETLGENIIDQIFSQFCLGK